MDLAAVRLLAERWIADDPDPATQAELRALLDAAHAGATSARDVVADLADRFAGPLEFGTAGLRGVIGAGPRRMNRAVVARATWAVARVLAERVSDAADRGVVVGGDGRRMSRELAEDVAAILGGAGIRVVLFDGPVPTPLVGFTVKRLRAAAGVVITASHNPAEYNGYKVYWEAAVQITPPVDRWLAEAIDRAPPARDILRPSLAGLRAEGTVTDGGDDAARLYLDALRTLAVHGGAGDRSLPIVYTPLHGTGDALVRRALAEAGFTHVTSVPEQAAPDAAFPTIQFPNPEERGALDLAIALAKSEGAALVLANDPDADRLAAAVPDGVGYVQLTGNQLGVLIGHYLLTERAGPPPKRAILSSIVSSPLLGCIAAGVGVHYEETLTGFKWIAARSRELEEQGYAVVLGYEEALGYSIGDVVRDKDGISAALVVAEIAAVLGSRGTTILAELDAIARRWGVFLSTQVNVARPGMSGAAAIAGMMDELRARPPAAVDGDAVVAVRDYEGRARRDLVSGRTTALTLPKSNVLALELASGSRIVARPSGTEPKAKFYFDVRDDVAPGEPVDKARARATERMGRLVTAFMGTTVEAALGRADG